ncbi:hypothetical protein Tco_0585352 [Tanacetum coccineum]
MSGSCVMVVTSGVVKADVVVTSDDGYCCPKHKQYDYQVDSPGGETYWFEFHKLVSQSKNCSQIVNLEQEVAYIMVSSMSPDLQRTLEKCNAYDMLKELKTMFEEQARQELFETVKAFHACKQEEGQSVSSYLLKMKRYLDTLERLSYAMPNELGVARASQMAFDAQL